MLLVVLLRVQKLFVSEAAADMCRVNVLRMTYAFHIWTKPEYSETSGQCLLEFFTGYFVFHFSLRVIQTPTFLQW